MVHIYTRDHCGHCGFAMLEMDRRGIMYEQHDIYMIMDQVRKEGCTELPILDVGGDHLLCGAAALAWIHEHGTECKQPF